MIRINLLPHHLRPIQRTPLPYILSAAVLVSMLAFMATWFMSVRAEYRGVEEKHAAASKALSSLAPVVEEYNGLVKEKVKLQDKVETIRPILQDRLLWSQWLHQLAKLTPENIWYKRIKTITRKVQMEQPKMGKNGQPERDATTGLTIIEKVPVDRQFLEVSGYAMEDESGRSSTAALAESTRNDEEFSRKFTMSSPRIEDTEFNGYAVRAFTFEYEVLRG
jgi:Tfp pilus assembly protein PilN